MIANMDIYVILMYKTIQIINNKAYGKQQRQTFCRR